MEDKVVASNGNVLRLPYLILQKTKFLSLFIDSKKSINLKLSIIVINNVHRYRYAVYYSRTR